MMLVEDKATLLHKLGQKKLTLHLAKPLKAIPAKLKARELKLSDDGKSMTFTYDTHAEQSGIAGLMDDVRAAKIDFLTASRRYDQW